MSKRASFYDELKRRNVVRMAGLYLVGAWLLIQVVSTMLPAFDAPTWLLRAVIITLAVGFIPALIFSWLFEFTPQGLKRDEDVPLEQSIGPQTARRMDRLIIVVLVFALGYFCFDKFVLTPRREAALVAAASVPNDHKSALPEKSIAVLPFENLSSDKDNAYFTDGVQDEILTDLAKVADLKVISRTSVMQYREAASRNLRKIGQELGVAHVLEGSVQRAAGKVRVNAQLIDARSDAHLWAQTYDRDLKDVFAIQSEIAQTIAGQLQAKLSPNEQKAIAQPPTTDLAAHDMYVRARVLDALSNDPNGREYLLQAAHLLDEARQRDPNFLLAYCLLVEVHTDLYWGGFDHTPARLELARIALGKAEAIASDAGDVHLAKGLFAYHGYRDYAGARAEFALALRSLPNSSHLYMMIAAVDRRQGRWEDALKNFHRAVELDPLDSATLQETGFTYSRLRRRVEGRAYLERAVAANPDDVFGRSILWALPYFDRGETAALRAQLDDLLRTNPKDARRLSAFYVEVALAERNRTAAEKALELVPADGAVDTTLNALWPRDWFVGLVARSFGESSGAEKAFAQARPAVLRTTQEQPGYAPGWMILGLLDAGLGHKADAVAEGRRARELLPITKDAFDGPIYATYLAVIYAWLGEKDLAFKQLTESASAAAGIQDRCSEALANVRLSPRRSPLRANPRLSRVAPAEMNLSGFLAELKRRNVYKVAVGYAVVGWLVMQVAATIVPALHLPDSLTTAVVVVVLLGFPIAVIVAWAFEMTPEGMKRTENVSPNEKIPQWSARKFAGMVVSVGLLAAALLVFQMVRSKAPAPAEMAESPAKSIAVLPFENLSSDKDNAYFAEGIQDEILTRLSKIAALKVISRTSTQKYRSAPDNLREVGRELGVANLLEGSVQKIANAVHVNVQLIRAGTDEHLWAESYNRKLDDVFGVEGEVATAIADQLNAKLTGGEKAILTTKPTTNPQAYDDYLRGLTQARHFSEPSLEAAASFAKAVREDPQFALAWATLSRMDALIYFKFLDRSPARREAARQALAKAVRLQPDLLETQMARAYFQYWVLLDYRGARDMLEQLRAKWPGNSEIVKVLGWISARLGDWQKSADYLDQAIELNPRDLFLRTTAALDRLDNRDPSAALRMANDALAIEPDDGTLLALKAAVFQSLGELDQAQPIVERLNPADPNQLNTIVYQAKLRRKPASALHYFQSTPAESAAQPAQIEKLLFLADLLDSAGDQAKARAVDAQVRAAAEAALKEQPNNAGLLAFRAYALAGLGDRVAALDELDRCIALQAEDALDKGSLEEDKARVLARFGQKDEAIALLQHLLTVSYSFPVTPALLRLDPDWDNLRGDPRFKTLAGTKP